MLSYLSMMIGFYIILRCMSFSSRKGEQKEHIYVRIFSFITFLVALYCLYNIMLLGNREAGQLPYNLR